MPDLTPEPTPNPALPNSIDLGPLYSVISVTDGDTIRVNYRGKSEPVRFIAINTPEVANYGRQGECFGEEASAFTKRALGGKKIHLVSDGMQDDRDRYGRLLRFIFLANDDDETNFNETLVREGMATFEGRYPMIPEFRAALSVAQDQAMANHRGLWKACR